MFVSSKLLDEYLKALKLQRWTIGKAFRLTTTKNGLEIKTRPFKFGMITSGLVFLMQLYTALMSVKSNQVEEDRNVNSVEYLLRVMFGAGSLLVTHFSFLIVTKRGTLEKLFSGLTSFEKRYCANGYDFSYLEKRMLNSAKKTCTILREVGAKMTPFTLSLAAIVLPRLSFNVLSAHPAVFLIWPLEMLKPKIVSWAIIKITTFGFNLWFWNLTIGLGIILKTGIIIGTVCIMVANSMFQRRAQNWGRGSLGKLNVMADLKMYREIQLITRDFNEIHGYVVISCLSTAIIGQIVCVLGLFSGFVKGDGIENIITAYVVTTVFVNGLILCGIYINFIFGFCGNVNDKSKKCLAGINQNENIYGDNLLKRIVRSMPEIKIKLGGGGYIDKLTPVRYQQFTNERIADALLLRTV